MRHLLVLGLLLLAPPANAKGPLLIFGGKDHKVFLGCLTCAETDMNSVHNEHGPYGKYGVGDTIFNKFSDYGSMFSDYSACNPLASDPPVVVDKPGNYYGRLSVNPLEAISSSQIRTWLKGVCSSY
jgi:hypothetical protein